MLSKRAVHERIKMRIQARLFCVPLFLLLISGCTTLQSMETPPASSGKAVIYDVSYEKAFELALHACEVLDFTVESQNKTGKYIVAKNGISAWSWGERIGIYFREVSPNQTEVRVVSKAKVKTNVFAPKWPNDIHQAMQTRLNQLKAAKVVT